MGSGVSSRPEARSAGGVMLAGVVFWVFAPGPAWGEGSVDDELGLVGQVVGGRDEFFQRGGDECRVGDDHRGDGGLVDVVGFGEFTLGSVPSQVGQRDDEFVPQVEGLAASVGLLRPRVDWCDHSLEVIELGACQSCCMIHADGSFLEVASSNPIIPESGHHTYSTHNPKTPFSLALKN